MEKRNRSPEDILDALDKDDIEDEVERVRALTSAEVDRELAAAGEDPDTIGAGADTAFERGMRLRTEALKGSAKRAKSGRNVRAWIAATAAAASIGLVAVAVNAPVLLDRLYGHLEVVGRAPDVAWARAAALRAEASAACAKGLMEVCKARLDDARALDPGGEDTAEVRALRKTLDAAAPSKTRGADD